MGRELPIFEPTPATGAHAGSPHHAPTAALPITVGAGNGAELQSALRRHPDWIKARMFLLHELGRSE